MRVTAHTDNHVCSAEAAGSRSVGPRPRASTWSPQRVVARVRMVAGGGLVDDDFEIVPGQAGHEQVQLFGVRER